MKSYMPPSRKSYLLFQANLEKKLVSRGGQYFVGNNLTWADLAVFQFCTDGFGGKPPKVKNIFLSSSVLMKDLF